MVIAALLIGLALGAAVAVCSCARGYAGKLREARRMLEEAQDSLATTMKALAADALASNNESFLTLAKSQLQQLEQQTTHELEQRKQAVENLVAPIKESLQKVDGKLQELEVARKGAYSELSDPGAPARGRAEGTPHRDRQPRHGAALPRGARPLG